MACWQHGDGGGKLLSVVDHWYSSRFLSGFYDSLCEGRQDFDFYLPLVMSSEAVLDVGCGTGALLRLARRDGHAGRLCGLDPAGAMLERAREQTDVDWVLGDLSSVDWDREFDLVVMTGHAFQVLIDDDDLRMSLAAIRRALTDDGRFVFEIRNPGVREWEGWTPRTAYQLSNTAGEVVVFWREAELPVTGDVVRYRSVFRGAGWDREQVSPGVVRYLDPGSLSVFLREAGLAVSEQFGGWGRQPLTGRSSEIVTVAVRGPDGGAGQRS
ncbi:class I SAM-dependent methyltransferase [Streptomyces sp. NPDC052042]|uniref:class I SAM-dependent methyltransferase n=1 Tax=Streptomyces sp. NPDC052042 TaxID=3365683 RepID=UPI0037D46E1C